MLDNIPIRIICNICNNEFLVSPSMSNHKFCSRKCYYKKLKTQGRQNWQFKKGQVPWNKNLLRWNKGHKVNKETREKLSISACGENNHFWKGGICNKPNYLKEYKHKYYLQNKWRYRLHRQKRYALEKNPKDKLTIQIIQEVYEDNIKKFGTLTCYLCLKPIEFGQDCLEHKIPLSRGGTNEYKNLGIAHRKCNHTKFTKTEEEYRKEVCHLR